VWGRCPLVQRHADTFDDLLSIDDVDEFVSRSVRRPAIRMVRAGTLLDPSTYCGPTRLGGRAVPEVIDGRKVAEQIASGATLVLQSLHRQWHPLVVFADELMAELGHPVQINAYLTPSNAAGLASHGDDHDVLVVQIAGSKHWTVEGLGDVVLRRGDVLYLPAGCHHGAATTDDLSLHLTVGILSITYRAVLERVLGDGTPELDRPLPVGFHTSRSDASDDRALEVGVARMLNAGIDHLRSTKISDVVDRERRRQLVPYSRHGHLRSVLAVDALTQDDIVRWVTVQPRMQPVDGQDGRVRVLLADRILQMPRAAIAAVGAISETPTGVRVGDIPGLDRASRLVIARRLVLEGACVVELPRAR
jgi:hypothetical protein